MKVWPRLLGMCICIALVPVLMGANKCTGSQTEPELPGSTGTESGGSTGGGTGSAAITEGTIGSPPEGFEFTDESGNVIESYEGDVTVELRTDSGEVLLSFQPSGNINFSNVLASRDASKALVHFNSDSDKFGIDGSVGFHVPGLSNLGGVRVCPNATTLEEVAADCEGEITLTQETPSADGYTWANPNRSGTEDFIITADIGVFGTGAEGVIVAGGAIAPNVIRVQVDGVTAGHECEENGVYAAAYTGAGSFPQRDGEVITALSDQGGGTYIGDLDVGAGATDVAVVTFCDDSQQEFTATLGSGYDSNPQFQPEGTATSVEDVTEANAFTNQGKLNICARNMNVTPVTNPLPFQYLLPYPGASTPTGITTLTNPFANPYIFGYAYDYPINGYTPTSFNPAQIGTVPAIHIEPPAMIVEATRINVDGGTATVRTGPSTQIVVQKQPAIAGDRFATGIADAGSLINFDVSGLTFLDKSSPHPDVQGTIAEWCRCILGQAMGLYQPTTATAPVNMAMGANLQTPVTLPYKIGYFTVTNFSASAQSTSCLLP